MKNLSIITGVVAGVMMLGVSSLNPSVVHATGSDTNSEVSDNDGSPSDQSNILNSDGTGIAATKEYLSNLTEFGYSYDVQNLWNLDGLQYATKLTKLNLSSSCVTDLSPISNLTNLKELDISHSTFTGQPHNVDILKNLKNLTSLNLSQMNEMGKITDLSGLSDMTNMQSLSVDDNAVTNLNGLSKMNKLTTLSAKNNRYLTDISSLKNTTDLQKLNLDQDDIYDFSPLSGLKNLQDITLGSQNVELPDGQSYSNSFSFDLSKYISPDARNVQIKTAGMYSPGGASISDKLDTSDLSNIKINNINDSDANLKISFIEEVPIDDNYYPVQINVVKSYKLLPKLTVQNVTLKPGDKWSPMDGLADFYYVDKDYSMNKDVFNMLICMGLKWSPEELDTSKPNTSFKVTYSIEGFISPETITVTIKGSDKSSSSSGSSSISNSKPNYSNISSIKKLALITRKANSIPIYNQNGEKISNKKLDKLTTFYVDQKNVVDGDTYYEISDDNWIKASDVRDYTKESGVLQTKSDSIKFIVDSDGIRLNRGLKNTSSWLYSGYAEFDGVKYYRVATDEWVSASDVILYNKINGVVKANVQAQVYKDTGKKSNRALAKNSEFITDKISKSIDGETMYRVATDEWVKASDVTLE